MIRYFQKSLKPFIKVKMEQQKLVSSSFEEMMQKAVNVKAKRGQRSSIMVWDLDAYYPRNHCPSYNTFYKVLTQGSKDSFHFEEPKLKDSKRNLICNIVTELAKKKRIVRIRKRVFRSIDRNILESKIN